MGLLFRKRCSIIKKWNVIFNRISLFAANKIETFRIKNESFDWKLNQAQYLSSACAIVINAHIHITYTCVFRCVCVPTTHTHTDMAYKIFYIRLLLVLYGLISFSWLILNTSYPVCFTINLILSHYSLLSGIRDTLYSRILHNKKNLVRQSYKFGKLEKTRVSM